MLKQWEPRQGEIILPLRDECLFSCIIFMFKHLPIYVCLKEGILSVSISYLPLTTCNYNSIKLLIFLLIQTVKRPNEICRGQKRTLISNNNLQIRGHSLWCKTKACSMRSPGVGNHKGINHRGREKIHGSLKSPVSKLNGFRWSVGWHHMVCWSAGEFPPAVYLSTNNKNCFGLIAERVVLWHFYNIFQRTLNHSASI